jgi:hypothetical protein
VGRTLMYTAIGGLLLIVLSSVFLLDHGGARIPKPNSAAIAAEADAVTLHDLTTASGIEEYGGHIISTSGTLYYNSATNNFVITTPDANYEVVIDWSQKLGAFEGEPVRVIGKFSRVAGSSPTIEATSVSLLEGP